VLCLSYLLFQVIDTTWHRLEHSKHLLFALVDFHIDSNSCEDIDFVYSNEPRNDPLLVGHKMFSDFE
jgi:hypothetical protein